VLLDVSAHRKHERRVSTNCRSPGLAVLRLRAERQCGRLRRAQNWRFPSRSLYLHILAFVNVLAINQCTLTMPAATGWFTKLALFFVHLNFIQILTDFRNCFTVRIRRKFAIIPLLMIQPHLKCGRPTTLSREMSLNRANCRSVSLIMPLVIAAKPT